MWNFRDISALHSFLQKAYELAPGEPGQVSFAQNLQANGFTADQAKLYASTLLSRNAKESADCMESNARKLIGGTWVRAATSGIPGGWSSGVQESWHFFENLTYEFKHQTLESYSSPFGSGFSRPRSESQQGIWAPSDWEQNSKICVVVISLTGAAKRLQLTWTDSAKPFYPRSCSIDGQGFSRQF